jgi:hypothetical protein
MDIANNGLDVTAAGADSWDTLDEFHFAYVLQKGDFDIAVRVESCSRFL